MPRMTDAQQGAANASNASLVLLRSIKTSIPTSISMSFERHVTATSMSVYVICFGCVSYILCIILLCVFLICVPLRFVFRRFRRWAVSFFVLLFLGSKVRTWGEIRRLLKSRPSRQIPGQASTVQLFFKQKKSNKIQSFKSFKSFNLSQRYSKYSQFVQAFDPFRSLYILCTFLHIFTHLYI